jgi:hypothetical protein
MRLEERRGDQIRSDQRRSDLIRSDKTRRDKIRLDETRRDKSGLEEIGQEEKCLGEKTGSSQSDDYKFSNSFSKFIYFKFRKNLKTYNQDFASNDEENLLKVWNICFDVLQSKVADDKLIEEVFNWAFNNPHYAKEIKSPEQFISEGCRLWESLLRQMESEKMESEKKIINIDIDKKKANLKN